MVPGVESSPEILSPFGLYKALHGQLIKEIDDREPTGKEIEMRFVEETYNAPSFVTSKIAEKLTRISKAVGFLPAERLRGLICERKTSRLI
jgi:hypothetical protein